MITLLYVDLTKVSGMVSWIGFVRWDWMNAPKISGPSFFYTSYLNWIILELMLF